MYVAKNETLYKFWTPTISGTSVNPTGALPTFKVYNEFGAIYSGSVTNIYNISGVFGVTIPTTGAAFGTGNFYNVSAAATFSGVYFDNIITRFYVGTSRLISFSGYNRDVYHGEFDFCTKDASGLDRYSFMWYKNDGLANTGATTLNVFETTGSSSAYLSASMVPKGSGIFIYDTTTNRLATGVQYFINFSANIDGASRLHRIPFSRDSNV